MRKFLIFFIFFFLWLPFLAEGAARPLEIKYPTIPQTPLPTTTETEFPVYVKYIFNFSIWIGGLVALGVLAYAGFRYLTSAGQPGVLTDARNQILAAFLGLLILLSSWLILVTINPELKELRIKPPPAILPALSAGVYLCREETREIPEAWELIKGIKNLKPDDKGREEEIKGLKERLAKIAEKCWRISGQGEIIEKFNDKARFAYLVPSETGTLYGAILYEESKFKGRTQVIYALEPIVTAFEIKEIKPSSVRTFVLKAPREEVYVELYELVDFNRANPQEKSKKYSREALQYVGNNYGVSGFISLDDFKRVGSVKIEGDLIVIFFKDRQNRDWPPSAVLDVIVDTDTTLYDNPMGSWCRESIWGVLRRYPCPVQMVIVSADIY